MEQINETSEYYCKNCSTPLIGIIPNDTQSKNPYTYLQNPVEQSQRWGEIETKLKHYFKSAGIMDQSQLTHLTHRVSVQMASIMENSTEQETIQYAIQVAQGLLLDKASMLGSHKATPNEKPISMKIQNIEFWSDRPKHYLRSIGSIFSSLRISISKHR